MSKNYITLVSFYSKVNFLLGLECESEYLRKANDRYLNDIRTSREIQRSLHGELERLNYERDELMKFKKENDEAVHTQIVLNRALQEKYRLVT